jgi:biopolymer transport protein ExbB/TolQ
MKKFLINLKDNLKLTFLIIMFVCLSFCSFSYAGDIFNYNYRYRNDVETLQDNLRDMEDSLRRQETRQLNDRWERRQQMREQQGLPRETDQGVIGNALEEKRRELFNFYKR